MLKAKLSLIFIVYSNKRNGEDNENGFKKNSNNRSKTKHYFVNFFVGVLHDYNVKLPKTTY